MPNFLFHSPDNPLGFTAFGTVEQASAYAARLNHHRALNAWSYRSAGGKKERGVSLEKLLAGHDAAHRGNLAETKRLLDHKTVGMSS